MKKSKMGQSPKRKPSIKKYTGMIVISSTIGMVVSAFFIQFIGNIVGFGCNDVLIIFLIALPIWQFFILYGFYKGLVKYYNLQAQ